MTENKNDGWTVTRLDVPVPSKKPGRIFTVTTIRRVDPNSGIGFGARTVGWYKKYKKAEECVLKNFGDIYECGYYPYAVIEEVEEGLYPYNENTWWFAWDQDKKAYLPIEKPEKLKNICNYSIG